MSNEPCGTVLLPCSNVPLLAHVVLLIGDNRVDVLVLIWHGLCERGEVAWRDNILILGTPLDHVLRLVTLAIATRVFFSQGNAVVNEPAEIRAGLGSPEGARVLGVGLAVWGVLNTVGDKGGAQHLC